MAKLLDLSHKTFNRWMVSDKYEIKVTNNRHHNTYWYCICACGNARWVSSSHLVRGKSKSCGCLQKELVIQRNIDNKLPGNRAAFNIVMGGYMRSAIKRGLIFELTENEFQNLISQPCYYCGQLDSNEFDSKGSFIKYNGIDRVDNTKGYTMDNTVSCCKWCNRAKSTLTTEQFYNQVELIYVRLKELQNNMP